MKSIGTKRHKRLIEFLVAERKARGIRQEALAYVLRQRQDWISRIERGDRRIDVVEYLALADAIGFDPLTVLAAVKETALDKPLRPLRARPIAKHGRRSLGKRYSRPAR